MDHLAMKARKLTKRGRSRKAGLSRYPSGQIRHVDREPRETQESIMATALAHPHRRGKVNPGSRMHGSALGRLRLVGQVDGISSRQYSAGCYFAWVASGYMKHVTQTWPNHMSPITREFVADPGVVPAHLLEKTNDDRDPPDFDDLYATVLGCLADTGELERCIRVLSGVCVFDRDVHTAGDLGTLRNGLNRIANYREKQRDHG